MDSGGDRCDVCRMRIKRMGTDGVGRYRYEINGMGSGIGARLALDLFMGIVVERVMRKSVHANNNCTWGPAIANETTLLHLKIYIAASQNLQLLKLYLLKLQESYHQSMPCFQLGKTRCSTSHSSKSGAATNWLK